MEEEDIQDSTVRGKASELAKARGCLGSSTREDKVCSWLLADSDQEGTLRVVLSLQPVRGL